MKRFTQRDRDTLEAIEAHYARHGVAPTIRELCREMHVRSTSTMAERIRRLEAHGHITCGSHGQARTMRLTKHVDEARRLREENERLRAIVGIVDNLVDDVENGMNPDAVDLGLSAYKAAREALR